MQAQALDFKALVKFIVPLTSSHIAQEEEDEEEDSLEGLVVEAAPPSSPLRCLETRTALSPPTKPPRGRGWVELGQEGQEEALFVVLAGSPGRRRRASHLVAPTRLLLDWTRAHKSAENSISNITNNGDSNNKKDIGKTARAVVVDIDALIAALPLQNAALQLTKKSF
jgi:hypothetical protein